MDREFDVADSSDWLKTPIALLGPVETALRCQVCKDFYNTPMITSCSHTFCSLCIRRCLTNDGKCPSCRSLDQEIRLRRNWAVQELVDAFQVARPSILKTGQDLLERERDEKRGKHKRKFKDSDPKINEQPIASRRKTRSQSQWSPDSDEPTDRNSGETQPDTDGQFSECPICCKKMRIEDVFLHLDTHQEENEQNKCADLRSSSTGAFERLPRCFPDPKPVERLPSLSYSILNENNLRKKISALGIPAWGNKSLLIRRHTEWVNLWNANCDSSRPRSKRDLLHDLDVWERTQGGNAMSAQNMANSASSVMGKDFDGAAWVANHGREFQQLIARARRRPSAPKTFEIGNTDDGNTGPGEQAPQDTDIPADASADGHAGEAVPS